MAPHNTIVSKHAILIVESNTAISDFLLDVLTEEHYTVSRTRNGARALEALAIEQPALVLLDMHLPDMTIGQFMTQFHLMKLEHTRIVFMSTSPCEAESFLEVGSDMCLAKPFDFDILLDAVRALPKMTPATKAAEPAESEIQHNYLYTGM